MSDKRARATIVLLVVIAVELAAIDYVALRMMRDGITVEAVEEGE